MLRLRNLLTMTLLLIFFYMLKSYNNSGSNIFVMETLTKSGNKMDSVSIFVPKSMKKIDWHNYTQIEIEKSRVGIGEHGFAAHNPPEVANLEKKLYDVNGFNGYLSDLIALDRSVPDIRHPGCANKMYIESLPTVSVVVPFHNEHFSTLLRTAHSVINRSPPHLIKEVLLVDDCSSKVFLKKELEEYLAKNLTKVKVVRLPRRSGLITARSAGAAVATADVLIFLDSHTEANVNWLPPLLEPIALDYRTVVCPFIDVVAYDTFEYRAQDEGARGAFDWEFFYKRLPVLPKDEDNMPEPFESPVMAGGLFAISRAFFQELGGYDPGLDIWGGEQYELSFKIWQCGGRMLDAPCSRVGHIYRKFAPFANPNHGDFVGKNYRRVAEVWMDEYAEYLYKRRPHYRAIAPGDLSDRRAIRDRLHCKPFKWFMTYVAFDLPFKYPMVEPDPFARGRIRPMWNPKLCVDAKNGAQSDALALSLCSNPKVEAEFIFTWHKDIKLQNRNMCWDLPNSGARSKVQLYSCHLGGGNQLWRFHLDTKQIRHGSSCLDYDRGSGELFVNPCDDKSPTQQWKVDMIDFKMMSTWDEERPRPTGPPSEK
ncbi:N-acetylgalactosaminyltransferase 6-like [Plodia interpunctella]|uniref:N-acetylgalactosaminyltransferase 6-like n=1 Tax=Plodia interpunctella TaxID=58824 RepID=UPI003100D664